jgi:hypothetical protein
VDIHRGLPSRRHPSDEEFPTSNSPAGARRNPAHIRQI